MKKSYPYEPKYAVKPGETIKEYLEHMGITQGELAHRMGRPVTQISRIINARIRITVETALQLERILARPAHFWMNLETNYRIALASKKPIWKHK